MKNKAVFLDRDGVVNQDVGYLTSWLQFDFVPGFLDALKLIKRNGFLAIVLTNQSGVNRNLITEIGLEIIHWKMKKVIRFSGTKLDDIFYCKHIPEDNCDCRKPKPGMVLKAVEKYNIDLEESYIIGDKETDIDLGIEVGCKTILLNGTTYLTKADFTAKTWEDIINHLNLRRRQNV